MPTFVLTPAHRVSGDTRNGVYVLPLKFNAHYPTRVYRITQIQVRVRLVNQYRCVTGCLLDGSSLVA